MTAEHADRIQIEGRVEEQARVAVVPATEPPAYRLCLTVIPDVGLPYVVSQHLGTDRAAEWAARSKARMLKRGTWVKVFASHLQLRYDHDRHALIVKGITDVMPADMPTAHSKAAAEEDSNAR
jgi:hypothetical protein